MVPDARDRKAHGMSRRPRDQCRAGPVASNDGARRPEAAKQATEDLSRFLRKANCSTHETRRGPAAPGAATSSCCKAGSLSPLRSAISACCSWSRATATGRGGSAARAAGGISSIRLSLAIYCTSWTFFGSVGLASRTGFDFLTIYIGPILMIGLCSPLIMRIVRLAKAQNITSIADFIAARYGKAQTVAADGGADRDHRHDSLHRAAAQGGVVLARHDPGAHRTGQRRDRSRCSATSRCSSRWRWRSSPCCSARATSTPPSIRTA